jgi:hypothetical protein
MVCPICRRPNLPYSASEVLNADARTGRCAGCGTYEVSEELLATKITEGLSADQRLRLAGAIRRASDESRRLTITVHNYAEIAAAEHLPDAIEQSEKFVGAVARASRFGTGTPPERCEAWTTRLYLPDWTALRDMQKQSGDLVVLPQEPEGPVAAPTGTVVFKLTLEGWRFARELRTGRGGNQAFVAMWFHDGLRTTYTNGIKPALEEVGYAPFRIDFAHHNRRIDDEIMAQIRQSRLLVADATGGRPSVYYEAGVADGLGIPVIWCCNNAYRAHVLNPSDLAPRHA